MKTTHTVPTPTAPRGEPTPAMLNKLILQRTAEYIERMSTPAGPLPERMRKMLAQPGFLFRRQAE